MKGMCIPFNLDFSFNAKSSLPRRVAELGSSDGNLDFAFEPKSKPYLDFVSVTKSITLYVNSPLSSTYNHKTQTSRTWDKSQQIAVWWLLY